MIFQTNNITGAVTAIVIIIAIIIIIWLKTTVVVPFNEIHVVSRGQKIDTYDGRGRYRFFSFFYGRTVIPKHVMDIEPGLIKLLDQDNLPFGVEVSVKVQVQDPQKAAATLTRIDHQTVSKVVEDTVMSAARSVAMERNIINIMKKREEIEQAIYRMVADALNKLGLAAIIFDIKNIRDIEGSDVILSLEKVKIAELRKNARISEATHSNEAIVVEVEKQKDANVKTQRMKKEEDDARLDRDKEVAQKQMLVDAEKMKIDEMKSAKLSTIERDKKLIESKARADSIEIEAKSAANAIKLKGEAEAEAIRQKGFAEADIMLKKAEAMAALTKQGNIAGQIKLLEILGDAQVKTAEKIAEALGQNNKIIYLPTGGDNSVISSFMPKIDALIQSGLAGDVANLLRGNKTNATTSDTESKSEPKSKKSTV